MKQLVEVGALKEGGIIVIEEEPCKILSISISKTGKHGAAKSRIEAMGVFDGKRRVIVEPTDARIYAAILERRKGQVVAITESSAQVMDLESYQVHEIPITLEQRSKIAQGQELWYLTALGKYKLDL